jgi:hypothetical protein
MSKFTMAAFVAIFAVGALVGRASAPVPAMASESQVIASYELTLKAGRCRLIVRRHLIHSARQRRADPRSRWRPPPHGGLDVQRRGVEHDRLSGRLERRDRARTVALVAAQDVGEDRGLVGRLAGLPSSARGGARVPPRRRTKIFTSARGRSTVPMSRRRARAGRRLQRNRAGTRPARCALRNGRDDRGGLADRVAFQRLFVEVRGSSACAAAVARAASSSG